VGLPIHPRRTKRHSSARWKTLQHQREHSYSRSLPRLSRAIAKRSPRKRALGLRCGSGQASSSTPFGRFRRRRVRARGSGVAREVITNRFQNGTDRGDAPSSGTLTPRTHLESRWLRAISVIVSLTSSANVCQHATSSRRAKSVQAVCRQEGRASPQVSCCVATCGFRGAGAIPAASTCWCDKSFCCKGLRASGTRVGFPPTAPSVARDRQRETKRLLRYRFARVYLSGLSPAVGRAAAKGRSRSNPGRLTRALFSW
jgi:hypothetical protein